MYATALCIVRAKCSNASWRAEHVWYRKRYSACSDVSQMYHTAMRARDLCSHIFRAVRN